MTTTRRLATWAAAAWLFALPLQSATAGGAQTQDAQTQDAKPQVFKAGAIIITQSWSRATPGGARVGGGYMTITNTGKTADRLMSATSGIAARVSIHTMTMIKGVMRMRAQKGGLAIEPGQIVQLAPGGRHLMLIGLKKPIRKGRPFKVQLSFERAGDVSVTFKVEAIGATRPSNRGLTNMKRQGKMQNGKMPTGMMQPGDGKMPMQMDHRGSGSHNR